MPNAVFGILAVLDDPLVMGARGEISAAREFLDRTSLIKKEQLEVTANTDVVFGLPPKN